MPEPLQLIYTAAHATADNADVPIGGGGAICRLLADEWCRTAPFPLRVLGPAILGADAPQGKDLITFGEHQYARFCARFSRAATEAILCEDPARTVVLVNDVSEGPDFERLAAAGFRLATIYHVDVVAYVAAMYLRGVVRPETTVRWYEWLERVWVPEVTRLVWSNQRASVRHSRLLIVPSAEMKDVMERCYPSDAPGKVRVLPWGVVPAEPNPDAVIALRREFGLNADTRVLLTLSRISPEKGQDTLIEALIEWESSGDIPCPIALFICGGAAYMQGQKHLNRLQKLAAKLRRIQTFFPGHVTGRRKQAFFAMADLYVFPSRHESYGLTLLEALQAGLPAVCVAHHGASQVMRPEFGKTVPPDSRTALWQAIRQMLSDDEARARMSAAARAFAATQRFEHTAAKLAEMLIGLR